MATQIEIIPAAINRNTPLKRENNLKYKKTRQYCYNDV